MPSGNVARKDQAKLAHDLSAKVHLKEESVFSLLRHFLWFQTDSKIERSVFREFLHTNFMMVEDILLDRVFKAFDKDNDGFIQAEEWIEGLNLFINGNEDDKVKFCFKCYDLNSDGYISREEMLQLLKNCMVVKHMSDEDADEGVKDLVEITLKMMDHDRDGRLSFSDFQKSVKENPLLLETFGVCLPPEYWRKHFLMKHCPGEPEAVREMQLQHRLSMQQLEQQAAEKANAI